MDSFGKISQKSISIPLLISKHDIYIKTYNWPLYTFIWHTHFFYKNRTFLSEPQNILKIFIFFLISHQPLPPKLCLKCFFLCTVSFGEVFFSANKFFVVFGIILDQIWASVILIKKILIKKKCVMINQREQLVTRVNWKTRVKTKSCINDSLQSYK